MTLCLSQTAFEFNTSIIPLKVTKFATALEKYIDRDQDNTAVASFTAIEYTSGQTLLDT